jgi:hypothetical protein
MVVGRKESSTFSEANNSRAQTTRIRRRVGPIHHKIGSFKHSPDNLALHADAFAVNDAHDPEAFRVGFAEVFFDDGFDLSRRDRVEIENVCDLDHDGFREWVEVFFGH